MRRRRVAIIGAGIGGMAAAIDLARAGCDVTIFEQASTPGGKLRELRFGERCVDSGPTVLTMRWIFDELFDDAGAEFGERLALTRAAILARNVWPGSAHIQQFSDSRMTSEAIEAFAGAREARGYRTLCRRAARLYDGLERPFLRGPRPGNPLALTFAAGPSGVRALLGTSPFRSLWSVLRDHFRDQRLLQLFGRYATYCGTSPFAAPATLLLIIHVEQCGVWFVEGGMQRLADAFAGLARELGASIRCSAPVSRILTDGARASGVELRNGERFAADAVIANVDVAAINGGHFGEATGRGGSASASTPRSLSAMTWSCIGSAGDYPLRHHNVFFSSDYPAEFRALERSRMPREPTVYVCAQDRDVRTAAREGGESLFILINAPAIGDTFDFNMESTERCRIRTFEHLQRAGLELKIEQGNIETTTPTDFAARYPGSGGALYGSATHGWKAAFRRPGARTSIPRLYLAGGSVHPGPGLAMATLSGRQAAASLMADSVSIARSQNTVMHGGMSMR